MKDSPVQARKRAENPADGLTRMLWSSSGRRRRQGFQPISSWYRRTLHCSCNSQLRSPRSNCVSAWYGLCMNSRALLLLQSNMPEASSRHQQSILRHATLQCVWHQCVRVRGKTHEVSGNVRRHVWCCSHPLSQWVDNYNREERAEKINTPVWVNSQRLNGVTVHYRGVYGKAVAVQFTESVTFSFGVLHIHVHAHTHTRARTQTPHLHGVDGDHGGPRRTGTLAAVCAWTRSCQHCSGAWGDSLCRAPFRLQLHAVASPCAAQHWRWEGRSLLPLGKSRPSGRSSLE